MPGPWMRIWLGMVFVWGVIGTATQTLARPLERHFGANDSCYERVYSGAHLAKHKTQRVTSIRFDHFPKTFGTYDQNNRIAFDPVRAEVYFSVSARFRDSGRLFTNSGICTPQGQIYRCQIECDGGGFSLKHKSAGSILLINETGFAISGCDAEVHRWLDPHPDDKVFRLDRVAAEACTPPR